MTNKINAKTLIICLLLLLAFFLRWQGYASFPVFGETQDEVAWTWLGTSLLTAHPPTTWSGTGVKGYPVDYDLTLGEQTYRIVSPYLDNPYLFSLIPGSVALHQGFVGPVIPSLAVIRFPMLFIGTLNVWLLYLFVKKIYGQSLGYLAGFLYATIPTMVFSSRVVVAENALITVMLLTILILAHRPKITGWLAVWLGLLSGIGLLIKVAGIVIPVSLLIYCLIRNQLKLGLTVLGIALLVGSLYPLYGLVTAPDLFLAVMGRQISFDSGLAGIFHLFIYPQLVQKALVDGWIYLGLISLFAYLFSAHQKKLGLVPLLCLVWLGFLLTATPEVASHGWYVYPLFPLTIIAFVQMFNTWRNSRLFPPLFSVLVLLPTIRLLLLTQSWFIGHLANQMLFLLVFMPILLKLPPKSLKFLNTVLVILAITVNCFLVSRFDRRVYWEDSLHFYPIRTGN